MILYRYAPFSPVLFNLVAIRHMWQQEMWLFKNGVLMTNTQYFSHFLTKLATDIRGRGCRPLIQSFIFSIHLKYLESNQESILPNFFLRKTKFFEMAMRSRSRGQIIEIVHSRSLQDCQLGQVRSGQVRLGQVRLGQVRLGQVRLGQVRLGQVRLGQGIGKVRLKNCELHCE